MVGARSRRCESMAASRARARSTRRGRARLAFGRRCARAIAPLLQGMALTREQARTVMDQVMAGEATAAQIAGLLIALRANGETVEEMTGFVESMRAHATPLELPPGSIDTCGTGGDRAGTFNISTAAALVAAGAGIPVAKHGNRAASSRCGSADVLEALGVDIP